MSEKKSGTKKGIPLSCILGFHKWNGTKVCSICGKTRGK